MNLARWFSLFVPLAVPALGVAVPSDKAPMITPQVDQRVELFSIIFRLAGNPEYNMNHLAKYSSEIDNYFASVKDNAAITQARKLFHDHGISFDAVMAMAISVSPPPELKPLAPFGDGVPKSRWDGVDTEGFLRLVRDFYHESRFGEFFTAHAKMYRVAEERFASTFRSVNLGWYPKFYGSKADLDYHLILGMNNGAGNYGPHLVLPGGRTELFSIIGCWTHDADGNPVYPQDRGYLRTIVHEFNHSFVNPAVSAHWQEFGAAETVFQSVADKMRRQAYVTAQTMVQESLVRAAVIVYFRDSGEGPLSIERRVRDEQKLGFLWMDQLVDLVEQYETQRSKYPTFAAFMSAAGQFYAILAPRMKDLSKSFEVQR